MFEPADRFKRMVQTLRDTYGDTVVQDPFQLAETLGVHIRYFDLGTLKGFYTICNNIPFIALHKELSEDTGKIVCAHELSHHLLHRSMAETTFFNAYELYRMENRLEREANLFASLLLIPDAAVEWFRAPENRGLSLQEAAGRFCTTKELLAIRLRLEGLPAEAWESKLPTEEVPG